MKVSEITTTNLSDYLRLDDLTVEEITELNTLLTIAKKFIKSYTGLDELTINNHEDFVIVVYVLVQDMYDNRTLYVDKNNLNKVVDSILGMHCTNLL
jgi:hypothetical protein